MTLTEILQDAINDGYSILKAPFTINPFNFRAKISAHGDRFSCDKKLMDYLAIISSAEGSVRLNVFKEIKIGMK